MNVVRTRVWGLGGLLFWLAQAAWAQATPPAPKPGEESPGEPADLPVIHVPTEPDALPDRTGLDYQLTLLVQGDGLGDSNVSKDNRKETALRRARVSSIFQYNLDWRLKASADFANAPNLRDLSLEYRGLPVEVEAGRIVEPFGVLSGGSTTMALMERPIAEGLAPGYGLGIAGNAHGDRWSTTGGVFESTQNNVQEGGRSERAITLRQTFAPVHKENQALHFGLEASYRESKGGTLQFVAIPESVLLYGLNISSAPLFQNAQGTGHNQYELYGAELGGLFGPMLILTEGTWAHVHDAVTVGGPLGGTPVDAYFSGYYLELSWALGGSRRDYSVKRGVFSGLETNSSVLAGGIGAFEIAARIGAIDLQDPNVGGETGATATLGLNWYPEEHSRITLEDLWVGTGGSSTVADGNALQLRMQVLFSAP